MLMETHRPDLKVADVVLGLCPGCELWQLDYTYEAARTYCEVRFDEVSTLGGEDLAGLPYMDASDFHQVVEDALREHLEACPHLQRALFDFG